MPLYAPVECLPQSLVYLFSSFFFFEAVLCSAPEAQSIGSNGWPISLKELLVSAVFTLNTRLTYSCHLAQLLWVWKNNISYQLNHLQSPPISCCWVFPVYPFGAFALTPHFWSKGSLCSCPQQKPVQVCWLSMWYLLYGCSGYMGLMETVKRNLVFSPHSVLGLNLFF